MSVHYLSADTFYGPGIFGGDFIIEEKIGERTVRYTTDNGRYIVNFGICYLV
jgi:hypothetical protein